MNVSVKSMKVETQVGKKVAVTKTRDYTSMSLGGGGLLRRQRKGNIFSVVKG